MADRSIKINLGVNVTGLTAGFKTAQKSAQDFSGKLRSSIRDNSGAIDTLSNRLGAVGIAATAAAGLAVKKFADFDQAMSNVAASTMESAANMDLLRAAALDAGARTVYSATEAAAAVEELAKAGVSTADVLGGGLDGALDLAAAGGIAVAEAAETAASAMTQFGLKGSDVTHIADLLAAGAGKAQGGVSDLGQALNQSGLVASQMGLSIEETVGSLTAFASAGLTGSDAGTSFRAMLLRLANPTKESGLLMEELGINAYDAGGNFVGMASLADQLQSSLGGLTQAERDQALAQIFGQDAIRTSNLLYREGAAGVTEWTAAVNDQGYAAEVAAKRMDNLAGDLEGLSGSFETLLIGIGEGANGPLRSLVQAADDAVDSFNDLPDPIKQASVLLIGGAGLVTLGIAGLGKLAVSATQGRDAMRDLGLVTDQTAGRMGKLGRGMAKIGGLAAAVGATAAATGMLVEALRSGEKSLGANELAAAVKDIAESGDDIGDLSGQFSNWGTVLGISTGQVKSLSEAFDQMLKPGAADKITSFFNGVPGLTTYMEKLEDRVAELDSSLASMVASGDVDAVEAFQKALEAEGYTVDEINKLLPQTKDALIGVADAAQEVAPAIESTTTAFDDQAEAADNAWDSIKSLTDGMAGLRDSQRGFEAAIDDARKALKENGKTLDINTAKGRANEAALDDIATSGMEWVDSMREQGASQDELQGAMSQTRDEFIKTARQMGMSKKEAKELARELGLIPGKVTSTVEVNTSSAKSIIDRFISDQAKRQIRLNVVANTGGAGPRGVQMRASGGSVRGPGTATSDSIPALLSNGEHVLTASDVQKAGGQGAIYGMRSMIQSGLLRFAGGGAVSAAERDAAKWAREVRAARAAVKAARRTGSDRDDDAARKRLDRAEDRLDAARAKRDSLRESRADLQRDVRRGSIMEQGTSGLSGALSVVDSVYAAGQDSNLSKGRRAILMSSGKAAEASLARQYALLEQANASVESYRNITQDVLSLREQIANSIKSEVRLTDTLGGKTDLGYDKPVTSGAIRAYVQEKLGKIRVFNGRVDALRKKGAPKGLLAEVMAAGIEGGAELAHALLTGPASDFNAIKSAWGQIDAEATRAGNIGTLSQFGTTGAAAEAELKRRESAAGRIETSIERLISGLQSNLSTAYIKRAGGGWVYGPGSSTSDSVHLAASNGEYVVNAKSAAAHGPLLEAINSGVRLSLPSVSRPAIQAAPVGGSSVDAVAAITAALTQMTVQVVNQFGVRESARIVSAGIGEVARNDPGQLRGAMTKAGV